MPELQEDLGALASDPNAWWAVLVALAFCLLVAVVGSMVGRRTGLISADAPAAEGIGIALALGLLAIAATYATVSSQGNSALVPVLVLMVLAVGLGTSDRVTRPNARSSAAVMARAAAASALVIVGFGALYGITIAPSPRDGVQPTEFNDTAYYSVLAAELNATGRESVYAPSGFDELSGLPAQTWYHWGELWLAAAVLNAPTVTPIHARHLVILPVLLLAAACLGGSLARRAAGDQSREALLLGALGVLLLAPIPLSVAPYFDWLGRGMIISVTHYGLVALVVLLGLLLIVQRRPAEGSWPFALMCGAVTAALIATHVGIAAVVAVGMGVTVLAQLLRGVPLRGIGADRPRVYLTVAIAAMATLVWGVVSGHGLGGAELSPGVQPFAEPWQRAVILTTLGAAVLLAAPLAWFPLRRSRPVLADLALGAAASVVAGALLWGIGFGSFNLFHLYFGAIVVVATPVAVASVVAVVTIARTRGRRPLAVGVLALFLGQAMIGGAVIYQQLETFGPGPYRPAPMSLVTYVRTMPPGSKMAYACQPLEEIAFWDPRLVSLQAHTSAHVVPMCFQGDSHRQALGMPRDPSIESPFFRHAPQRELWSTAATRPDPVAVRDFLERNGVRYIYSDGSHPNTLVGDLPIVFAADDVVIQILE